jgi:hypothetical protein
MFIEIKYDRIKPFYLNKKQKLKLQLGISKYGFDWTHSNFDWYKKFVKRRLRNSQQDLCCYCRRLLKHDKGPVEIEHVINKSKSGRYDYFTFEIKNLALSCKDCNNGKGVKSVLMTAWPGSNYPKNGDAFKWVHPYFHKYSDHIIIHHSWVYEANGGSENGFAVIEKCELKDLEGKEKKNRIAIVGRAKNFEDALKRVLSFSSEVTLDRLCRELSPLLVVLMEGKADLNRVEEAIRKADAEMKRIAAEANA